MRQAGAVPPEGNEASGDPVRNKQSIAAQLQRVSFAFSRCLLVVEGSPGSEQKLADQVAALFRTARHCSIALQYFYSPSQAATEASPDLL